MTSRISRSLLESRQQIGDIQKSVSDGGAVDGISHQFPQFADIEGEISRVVEPTGRPPIRNRNEPAGLALSYEDADIGPAFDEELAPGFMLDDVRDEGVPLLGKRKTVTTFQ
jgi:hypothetical protein